MNEIDVPSSLPSSVSERSNILLSFFSASSGWIFYESTANLARENILQQSYKFIVGVFFSDLEKWFSFYNPQSPQISNFLTVRTLLARISHSTLFVWWEAPSIEKWDEQNGISFSLKFFFCCFRKRKEIEKSKLQKTIRVDCPPPLCPSTPSTRANLIIFQREEAAKWWRGREKSENLNRNATITFPIPHRRRYSHAVSPCRSRKLKAKVVVERVCDADKKAAIFKRN